MIGRAYWATGIQLDHLGRDEWGVMLKFYDDGFCDSRSTEGELRLRYAVGHDELDDRIDTLLEDAKRLGIVWNAGVDGPTVYIPQDGEDEERTDNDLMLREAARQCERLGWKCLYEVPA